MQRAPMDGYGSLVSLREGGCLIKPKVMFACFRPMTVLVLSNAPSSPHALASISMPNTRFRRCAKRLAT